MSARFTRRDFLRLAGLAPLSLLAPDWSRRLPGAAGRPNVLILVFDALSALNVGLYGYARDTMPNLARLAQRAIVYHNHFASSNFTTSGTASLLTGTEPWTHRALLGGGRIARPVIDHNLFQIFSDYYRLGYSHNRWAQVFLIQFADFLDEYLPREKLYLATYDGSVPNYFPRDVDAVDVAWTRYLKPDGGHSYSLFLSSIYEALHEKQMASYADMFPRGLPTTTTQENYTLEDAVRWLDGRLPQLPQPFLGYVHFLPPHAPYATSREFYHRFLDDGMQPDTKPHDPFYEPLHPYTPEEVLLQRTAYDEFLLYADKALGAIYDSLEASGILKNTWLVFTSDHGEMFERGIVAHNTPVLYQPAVRVPLLIFEPGRAQRMDIHDLTSDTDVVPTLAHLTGHDIPSWVEGQILPPFGPSDANRSIYAVHARENDPFRRLYRACVMMLRGGYKLQYYFGYKDLGIDDFIRLYDIQNDPEELTDLAKSRPGLSQTMFADLKAKLAEVNKPYRRGA
jgi:arylsulfatase A-like enzyme